MSCPVAGAMFVGSLGVVRSAEFGPAEASGVLGKMVADTARVAKASSRMPEMATTKRCCGLIWDGSHRHRDACRPTRSTIPDVGCSCNYDLLTCTAVILRAHR